MVLDAVILDIDRHLGNFGVLFDTDTMEIQSMAPGFDNNCCLRFDLDDDQLDHAERYIPRLAPRLGTDFVIAARALLNDAIRSDLVNLQGFAFRQHPDIPVEGE